MSDTVQLSSVKGKERVQFKLCLLMYKSLHGMAPTYLAELCQSFGMVDALDRLRSAERGDLITPRSATKFGDRAFAISGRMYINIENWH